MSALGQARSLLRGTALDVAFAVALATIAVVNVVQEARPIGGRIGIVCAALALTLPLAFRRRHALIAALVMTTALVLQSVATDSPEAIWTLVAVIVMAYSTGAYERLRGALLGAGALAVGLPLSVALDPSDTPGNIAPTLLIFAGRSLVGDVEPSMKRPDVAKDRSPRTLRSGFSIEAVLPPDAKDDDIRAFAVIGQKAFELPRL